MKNVIKQHVFVQLVEAYILKVCCFSFLRSAQLRLYNTVW